MRNDHVFLMKMRKFMNRHVSLLVCLTVGWDVCLFVGPKKTRKSSSMFLPEYFFHHFL